ncbi:N-acetylmuramoyl-L-alanine amidase [Mitsuokella multacida]|nr:N-acetylmuramoyl-L-alanine amidase [Mitsuokella multacida]
MMVMGIGLALAPELAVKQVAEAAWQDGGDVLPGVTIRPTHLSFRSLTNRRRTDAIIVHHVGNTNADVSAETIHQWHLANGWAGIGYHFVIRKDGSIEQGRPMDTVGAHCYGENDHTVGVNLVGNFEDYVPEDAQVASAKRLLAALCRNYGFAPSGSTIFGHRDFNATACPGQNLYDMLPDIIRGASSLY